MSLIVGGAIGGLVATIVMTILMKIAMGNQPGPPQIIVAKVLSKPSDDIMIPAMMAHFSFGTVAGIVGLYILPLIGDFSIPLSGIIWGVLLMIGAIMQMMTLGLKESVMANKKMPFMMLMMHLVYGLVWAYTSANVA